MKTTLFLGYLVYFITPHVNSAYVNTQNPACANIPIREKVDCLPGPTTKAADCIAKGCCWQPIKEPGPFCYYDSTHKFNFACISIPNNEKIDCLPGPHTTQKDCLDKGCCWQQIHEPGPYCYYNSTYKFNPACLNIPNKWKIDCLPGPHTTQRDCLAKGCCWQQINEPGPFCYYDNTYNLDPTCVNIPTKDKIDCLPGPTTKKEDCVAKGCCWQPINEPGPYCYYKSTHEFNPVCTNIPNKEKINCLPGPHATEEDCTAKGCCWQPINEPGPYCYYNNMYKSNSSCAKTPNVEQFDCVPDVVNQETAK